jgi:predicted regulator of Ras-like GTPase activity (Roadblock/LC7/MglB family)
MDARAATPIEPVSDWRAPAHPAAVPPPPTFEPPAVAPARAVPTTAGAALDELTEVIVGARGAVLASIDGFSIARSVSMPAEAAHAAMLAAAVGLGRRLVGMADGTELRQLVVDHDEGLLLLWPIGPRRVLAMLTDSRVDQLALRRFVRSRARLLADGAS